jgi:2-deoxy-D-gluconate 3-dehydrogenase
MILDRFRLDGKSAIVTGASKGIGAACAVALAEAGANVLGVSRTSMQAVAEKVQALGRKFISFSADLSRMESIPAIISAAQEKLGSIDLLVNSAGIIRRNPVLEYTEQDWDEVMDVNLKSLFFLSQAAAKVMVHQGRGGKIIHIASMLSFQGGIRVAGYTASKSGVAGITKLMANELAGQGINVNAIAPGYIATDNTAPLRADPVRNKAILERIPANRWGEPEDIAGMAVFLASPAGDYCHGAVLNVDGGWLAR